MAKSALPIDGGFYVDASLPLSAQECTNWYIDNPQTNTITPAVLKPTPGINQLTTVSSVDRGRGSIVVASIPYTVTGSKLYRIDSTVDGFGVETFSTTELGVIPGTGRVSLATDGIELVVVSPGDDANVWNVSTLSFDQITDASFLANGPYDSVEYIDGYFTFTQTAGRLFINSPLSSALGPYNPLDTATAEADPDNIRGQVNFRNNLYIIGSDTTEVFENQSLVDAPFVRINGFILPKGLAAKFSIVKSNNTFAFIGSGENESPAVWTFTGNNYQKISNTAIDNILSKLSDDDLDEVFGWSYGEAGAYFIGFTLPERTFVYDFSTTKWAERMSTVNGVDVAYRPAGTVAAYGRIIVNDTQDGRIGELDLSIDDEYGVSIKRTIATRPFDNFGDELTVTSLEAVMETGVGNSTTKDPQLRMSFSDDGGRTWSNELVRSIGKVGQYFRRASWNRLGTFSRSRIFRFEYSGKAKTTFIKLEADIV